MPIPCFLTNKILLRSQTASNLFLNHFYLSEWNEPFCGHSLHGIAIVPPKISNLFEFGRVLFVLIKQITSVSVSSWLKNLDSSKRCSILGFIHARYVAPFCTNSLRSVKYSLEGTVRVIWIKLTTLNEWVSCSLQVNIYKKIWSDYFASVSRNNAKWNFFKEIMTKSVWIEANFQEHYKLIPTSRNSEVRFTAGFMQQFTEKAVRKAIKSLCFISWCPLPRMVAWHWLTDELPAKRKPQQRQRNMMWFCSWKFISKNVSSCTLFCLGYSLPL